jgi:hypothetical protein
MGEEEDESMIRSRILQVWTQDTGPYSSSTLPAQHDRSSTSSHRSRQDSRCVGQLTTIDERWRAAGTGEYTWSLTTTILEKVRTDFQILQP